MSTSPDNPPSAPAPADQAEWDGTNLAGDIVEAGIQKNPPEYHEDLRWWFRYAQGEKHMSQAEAARMLGVDGSTYNRVFRGEYKSPVGGVIPPPAKMLSRIRVMRQQERENAAEINKGRVMTPTVAEIHLVCRKAWADRQIALIWGESHTGKTEALKWFRDDNNHGSTIYVDLQRCTGVQDVYRAFASALRISPDVPIAKLMPRIFTAIDRTNLVIVDEFHHITYAYQKASSNRMVNALKAIKDFTGCAMVICATNVAREEFTEGVGREAKLLKQLWRRGVIKLQLSDALRVGDVRSFAAAYGLDFPPEPPKNSKGKIADTWKQLRADAPDFAGLNVCEHIAHDCGVLHLISVFKDAARLASGKSKPVSWQYVDAAQEVYDGLASKKVA